MKTFREFIFEVNRPELAHHTDADRSAYDVVRSRYDAMSPQERLTKIIGVGGRDKKTGIQTYGFKNKKTRQNQQTRKRDLTDPDDMKQGNKKEKKLKSVGLETHHITPLHYSASLKASMSPEQWAERVRKDAENKIYHGHHHKNLMGTVVSKTPERFRRTGILHRTGGAHELEAKTSDLYSSAISHKDILSAAQRIEMRKKAEERKIEDARQERRKQKRSRAPEEIESK